MKPVLYLSYDGMTDPLGQSQVLPYLIGLSGEATFHLISFEKPNRFSEHGAMIQALCDKHHITWHPLLYTKRPPVLSTIYDIYKLFRLAKKLDATHRFNLIHCRSYITALVGLSFKRKRNKKFIFDMRGFWADERVDGGIWKLNNPIYKRVYTYFKKKERQFLAESDTVVSLTENGKKELLSWDVPNLNPSKIVVIPCAADYELFDVVTDKKRSDAKHKLGFPTNTQVVSYLGSLGTWYLLDEMLLFFRAFKQKYPDSKFLILTGDDPNLVLNLLPKYELTPDDVVITFAKRAEITSFVHASDLSLIFIKPSYSKISSSPTKMGELLAMGIPVICNDGVGDVSLIMEQIHVGHCLSNLHSEEITKCIDTIDFVLDLQPEIIRVQSKEIFEFERNCAKYKQIYRTLL